ERLGEQPQHAPPAPEVRQRDEVSLLVRQGEIRGRRAFSQHGRPESTSCWESTHLALKEWNDRRGRPLRVVQEWPMAAVIQVGELGVGKGRTMCLGESNRDVRIAASPYHQCGAVQASEQGLDKARLRDVG